MTNIGKELQVKQMLQVLLGNENLSGNVSYIIEELSKAGLLTDNEIQVFQNVKIKKD